MAKNTGKEYEQFVESIYQALTKDERFTTVERDVKLEGKDGLRQIDVLLRSEVANLSLLTVIECRDYNKRLSIEHLDGLHSKLQDVNASKGVLVSRKGFSSTAKQKAARVGITLCLASDASSVVKAVRIVVPIKVRYVKVGFEAKFEITVLKAGVGASSNFKEIMINEINLFDVLHDKLSKEKLKFPLTKLNFRIYPEELKLPYTVKDSVGKDIAIIKHIKLDLQFGFKYYYGHLSDIPDLNSMHQYDIDSTIFVIKAENFQTLFKRLPTMTQFDSEDEIPSNYRLEINMLDYSYKNFMLNPITHNVTDQVVKVKRRKK